MKRKSEYNLSEKTKKNLHGFCAAIFPKKAASKNRRVIFLIMAWLIMVDRLIESRRVSMPEIRRFQKYINDILSSKKEIANIPKSFRSPAVLIQKINDLLSTRSPHPKIRNEWALSINRCLRAMVVERGYTARKMPALKVYLYNGAHSIGAEIILYAVAILFRPKIAFLNHKLSGIMKSAIKQSSLIFRLINDLGSYRREQKEQKISSISIVKSKLGSEDATKNFINSRIKQYFHQYKKMTKNIPLPLRPSFNAHLRLLNFAMSTHKINDYE